MDQDKFIKQLANESPFQIRRAVERLREGLFDPLAVRLLTAHENHLNRILDQGFKQLQKGNPAHLCICGSYGQGKSHSLTYTQDRAEQANYVTSMVNLDLREVPLHNFREVYRALVANLRFPGSDEGLAAHWKNWAMQQLEAQEASSDVSNLLPDIIPHVFKSILTGMTLPTLSLTPRQKELKKHSQFRPREYNYLLEKSLLGEVIPVNRLRHALKYRQVPFYREGSLATRGNALYLDMLRGLGALFQKMGYQGWVLLFDEGESVAQVSVLSRSNSYQIIQQLFTPRGPSHGLFPIFAFTDDFFQRVENEDYEKFRIRGEEEIPYFPENYAELWQELSIYHLQDLSKSEWHDLANKLIPLYAHAYQWANDWKQIFPQMQERLAQLSGEETRYKLKALIEQLDLLHQVQLQS